MQYIVVDLLLLTDNQLTQEKRAANMGSQDNHRFLMTGANTVLLQEANSTVTRVIAVLRYLSRNGYRTGTHACINKQTVAACFTV